MLFRQRIENGVQDSARHLFAAFDGVGAVHQHLRFDDRHRSLFLTQSRVSCEGMGIGADASCARHSVTDADHSPPFRKAGAEATVFGEPLAQPVEPLRYGFPRTSSQRPGTGIDLDARHNALSRENFGERHPGRAFLADRLVLQDHAADELRSARGREQHLAVGAAAILGRSDPKCIKAPGRCGDCFVGSEDSLSSRGNDNLDKAPIP